jgi:hypothetical protein
MIQEFLPWPEITSDVICDLNGSVLAVVSRQRIAARGGEVAKGVSMYDPQILDRCVFIAKTLNAIGPITIQCILNDGVHPSPKSTLDSEVVVHGHLTPALTLRSGSWHSPSGSLSALLP